MNNFNKIFACLFFCICFCLVLEGQSRFAEEGDFSGDCASLVVFNLTCGSNIIAGRVSGEEVLNAVDLADYFNFNLPSEGVITSVRMSAITGAPSHRSFIALWGGQNCQGGVSYANIQDPALNLFNEIAYNSALTLRGIDATFTYEIHIDVRCGDPCVPIACSSCEVYNSTTCACDPIAAPICDATCEVYNPSTCACDPVATPICDATCEVYNPSTCACDPVATPICNATCEVYNPTTCACDPVAAPICNATCEVYNPSNCACDPVAAPICNATCEVYNPSTCACDPVAAPICNATCEVYNPTTCACDPVATPICDATCEVYNPSTCACDSVVAPICNATCEVYNPTTCACDPIAAPICDATCEVYNPSTCACDPVVAPICNATCEVYNPTTCACDPIAAPICDATCEVYNPSTCACDPVAAPVCDATCEVYNPSTCACDPIATPACPDPCEQLEEASCTCLPIPNCDNTPCTNICADPCEIINDDCECVMDPNCEEEASNIEICDGIDNNNNGLIDENLDCSICPIFNYYPNNIFCNCSYPEIVTVKITNIRSCVPTAETFMADLHIYFDYSPVRGGLTFSGDVDFYYPFPTNNTSNSLVIEDQVLQADGKPINFLVKYKGQEGCYFLVKHGGLAPGSCEQINTPEITDASEIPTILDTITTPVVSDIPTTPTTPDTSTTPDTPTTPEEEEIVKDCSIQFIAIDNIERCSDNGSRFKYTDDYFMADLTVHYVHPSSRGALQLSGSTALSVPVAHLHSSTSHTFRNVQLPADGTDLTINAVFTKEDFCVYLQSFGVMNISDRSPCKTCTIVAAEVVNIQCTDDLVYFDLMVTGTQIGQEYQVNGASDVYTGVYNEASSFKAFKQDLSTLEIIDTEHTACTYNLSINTEICETASSRTATLANGSNEIDLEKHIQFSPNPARTSLIVDFQNIQVLPFKNNELLIYDLLGNIRMQQILTTNKGRVVLDIQSLENGLHLLVLKRGGLLSTYKFVKEDLR